MARPFLAELAVITDTVVATQQTDDSRSCRISAEAVAAGGFNSSGTPSLMNRQAEQTADQAAENMARIHQEIEDTKSAQTVALSEGEAVVAAALGEMVASTCATAVVVHVDLHCSSACMLARILQLVYCVDLHIVLLLHSQL